MVVNRQTKYSIKMCRTLVLTICIFFGPQVPPAGAEITQWSAIWFLSDKIEHVETRKSDLDAAYYANNARVTIAHVFRRNGVDYSTRYESSWGDSIGHAWQITLDLYTDHAAILRASLNAVRDAGGADYTEFRDLMRGFQAWEEAARRAERSLEAFAEMYGALGMINDQRLEAVRASRQLRCRFDEATENRGRCQSLARDIETNETRMRAQEETIHITREVLRALGDQIFFTALSRCNEVDAASDCGRRGRLSCSYRLPDPFDYTRGQIYYVKAANVSVVHAPVYLGARRVDVVTLNDRVQVIEGDPSMTGWIKVRTAEGREGYMNGGVLQDAPLDRVPNSLPTGRSYNSTSWGCAKG